MSADASPISLRDALLDRALLGAALGDASSWSTWLAVLAAAFGLPLTAEQAAIFASVAGGRTPPKNRVREFWAICGRRSGKSRMAAALACFIALFTRHTLVAGERGLCLVLAASIDQAKGVFSYARAFLTTSPVLAQEIEDITANEIRLRNGVIIGVHSNSYRTVRGRTLCGCIFDEAAWWRDETSATPDIETYTAVLPALATTNGLLVGISTPYRKIGLLHQKYRDYFGKDDEDTLVVQGASKLFNPLLAEVETIRPDQRLRENAFTEWHDHSEILSSYQP
jgi:phage terminase large subunit-like protein